MNHRFILVIFQSLHASIHVINPSSCESNSDYMALTNTFRQKTSQPDNFPGLMHMKHEVR